MIIARRAALLFVLGVLAVTVLSAERVPAPEPADAPAGEFSAMRADRDMRALAANPRPLGSPASDRARDYIADKLRGSGFDVNVDSGIGSFAEQDTAGFGRVQNVVGTRKGTASTGKVVLVAHYDSRVGAPGAGDDAAAVSEILEVARILGARSAPRNDVVVLATDGEETGLFGAQHYARTHPPGPNDVVLNTEALGVSGQPLLFETSHGNAGLVHTYADAAPYPAGDSSLAEAYRYLPNDTDFTPLRAAGYRGLNSAITGGIARYHTATDAPRFVDRGSVQATGANLLAVSAALADRDLGAAQEAGDRTYFQVFGWMVDYPNELVLPLAVLAAIAVLLFGLGAARAGTLTFKRWLLALASVPVPVVLAGVLGYAVYFAVTAIRPGYTDIQGANPYRPELFWAAVSVAGFAAVLVWVLLLRRRTGVTALLHAGLALLAALGVVLAVTVPGAAFLFAVPVLCAAFAGLVGALLPSTAVAATAVGAVPATVLLGPTVLGMHRTLGLAAAPVPAVVTALLVLFWLPLLDFRRGRLDWRAPRSAVPGALVLVVALIGAGLLVDRADADHPARADLGYVRDGDSGRGYWVTGDPTPGTWVRGYTGQRRRELVGEPVVAREGPRVELPAPEVRALPGGEVAVRSPRGAREISLRFDTPVRGLRVRAGGMEPVAVPGRRREVVFTDPPRDGFVVRAGGGGPLRLTAVDSSPGLRGVPGFTGYPTYTVPSPSRGADTVRVTKNYSIIPRPR